MSLWKQTFTFVINTITLPGIAAYLILVALITTIIFYHDTTFAKTCDHMNQQQLFKHLASINKEILTT